MPRLRRGSGGWNRGTQLAQEVAVPSSSSTAARTNVVPVSSDVRGGVSKKQRGGGSVKKGTLGSRENIKGVKKTPVAVKTSTAVKRPSPEAAVVGKGDEIVKKVRTKFPERLHWKMMHSRMPPTSTPKRNPRSHKITKYDIDTAFGFDDSCEDKAEYSTLLSPIAHASPKGALVPPVWKVNPLTQRNTDCNTAAAVPPTPTTTNVAENLSSSSSEKLKTQSKNKVPSVAPQVKVKKSAVKSKSSKSTKAKKTTPSAPVPSSPSPTNIPKSTKKPLHILRKNPLLVESKPKSAIEKNRDCDDETHQHGSSPFSQLLHKIHEDEPANEAPEELRVDPKKIVRTYSSRKRIDYSGDRDPGAEYDFVPKPIEDEEVVIVNANSRGPKSKKKGKKLKDEEDLDEDMKRWLEEKDKEFKAIEKTKLVIEQSFSD